MTLDDVVVGTNELLADWLESSLLVSPNSAIAIDKLIVMADKDLQIPAAKVHHAIDVVAKRGGTLGGLYPFEVVPGLAVRRRKEAPLAGAYAMLLYLTPGSIARQLLPRIDVQQMGELLEDMAEMALANLWGDGGDAIRFGYPSKHGRPEDFDQAVVWLAKRIGVEPGRGYRPPRRKDGGVDIVAWRQFLDGRRGFPIALAQCTVQEATFTKTTDIDLRLWSSWLALDSDPLSLLVIPGTVRRAGTEWGQLSSVVTVVERLRLIELLGRGLKPFVSTLWADDITNQLRQLLAAGEA